MYDTLLIINDLQRIENSLQHIMERTAHIRTVDDFLTSPVGVDLLDMVCMRLLAVGETVKSIDKHTSGQLLSRYPEIPWRQIMGIRDRIAHNYFEVNPALIFEIIVNNILPLLEVIRSLKTEVGNK
jgi:uncharacterized protein with HEPN domain